MILYYPMEHVYYLSEKGAWKLSERTYGRLAIWSCRFWAAYVVLFVSLSLSFSSFSFFFSLSLNLASTLISPLKKSPNLIETDIFDLILSRTHTQKKTNRTYLPIQLPPLPLPFHSSSNTFLDLLFLQYNHTLRERERRRETSDSRCESERGCSQR